MQNNIPLDQLLKTSLSIKKLSQDEYNNIVNSLATMSPAQKEELHKILLQEHYEYEELQRAAEIQILNKYLSELSELLHQAEKSIRQEKESEDSKASEAKQSELLNQLNNL